MQALNPMLIVRCLTTQVILLRLPAIDYSVDQAMLAFNPL